MVIKIVICSPVNRCSAEYGKHGCYDYKTINFFQTVMIVYFASMLFITLQPDANELEIL